ncbi:MAG: hypothetical protein WD645_03105 [Dehalococcoidia bacterium]
MSGILEARFRAASLVVASAVLLAGLIYHPHLPGPLPNEAAVAAAAASDTTRWGIAHLTIGIGSGLLAVAFLAIRVLLREAGDERWSGPALPFIVLGSTLLTFLAALEFAPLAAAMAGSDAAEAQAALAPWFLPILLTGSALFAIGIGGFVVGIVRTRVLSQQVTRVVVAGLVVMAISRFVPFTEAQLYVQGTAVVLALWPLAYRMWGQRDGLRAAEHAGAVGLGRPRSL